MCGIVAYRRQFRLSSQEICLKTLLVSLGLVLGMVGCRIAADRGESTVLMPVEEIVLSASTRANTPVEVQFVGLLTNGCQRFERLEVIETERSAVVRMWAREARKAGVLCNAEIRHVRQARTFRPVGAGQF